MRAFPPKPRVRPSRLACEARRCWPPRDKQDPGDKFWARCLRRHSPRRHLYLQIYFSYLAMLLIFSLVVAAVIWSFAGSKVESANTALVVLMEKLLPANATPASTQETLQTLAAATNSNVALYDHAGHRIAGIGEIAPGLHQAPSSRGVFYSGEFADGRRLVIDWQAPRERPHAFGWGWLALIIVVAALYAYPIARRLTWRIEALQKQADALGQGDLSARVEVRGYDEISELSHHFNQAAEHIESLVNSQRAMLASASHELRSPLARIRMASSLLGDERPELHQQIAHDIAELDALIGDLLLASRLAVDTPALRHESVDLLGLAAEEARRIGARVSGVTLELQADRRLLHHLLRNLLENTRRHAARSGVEVEIEHSADDMAIIRVLDRGPGVPEDEREKIFDPFYRPPGSAETGEGAGYGLALVRRIARLHGGEVRCTARAGGGACFEVRLAVAK